MKILDDISITGQPIPVQKAASGGNPNGATFDELLKEAVDGSLKGNTGTPATCSTRAEHLSPLMSTPATGPAGSQAVERIDRFLDVMDEYRCRLGDPDCSPKQLHPFMERMAAEREKLQPLLDELPEQDPLREVLNRALVAASTEVWKFNRGDYS